MDKVPFEDGVKLKNATVTVNEQEYEVTPAQYSGTTPMSAFNLNKMQDNIENAIQEKHYIVAYNNATQTFTKNVQAKVNLNTKQIGTDNFSLSNNQITCKENGVVGLSYKIYLSSDFTDADNILVKVYKNNTEINRNQVRPSGTGAQTICSELILQEVSENDIFHIEFINYISNTTTGNTSIINANLFNIFYI